MPKINVEKIQSLTGHKDCLYTIIEGEQSNFIYTSGGDGLVVRWNLDQPDLGEMVAKVHNSVYALAIDQQAQQLYIGHNFEGVHALDLLTKETKNSSKITDNYIFDLEIVDNQIYCACGNGQLVILDKQSLQLINKLKVSEASLRSLDFNKTSNELAIGTSDNTIYILDISGKPKLKQKLDAHTNSVFTTKFHPHLPYLLSAGRDAHLKIWNTLNYNLEEDIVAHMYAINNISFSPSGEFFATCSMDKSIKLWDAKSFKLLKVIDKARHAGHGTSVNKLLWTDHNHLLVSVSDDRTASIWNIQTEN